MTLSATYQEAFIMPSSQPIAGIARLGRLTHLIGSWTFIAIGAGHTATQFTTLSSDRVQDQYRAGGDIEVSGQVVDGWELFAGTSILMGVFAIALGALSLAALRTTTRHDRLTPAIFPTIGLAVVLCVLAVGASLLGPLQLYGGAAGVVMFGLPLLAVLKSE